jgi:hypothetical protein
MNRGILVKRKIAAILSLIFIFTLILPLQGFAAEMDKELESAIKIVKTKFSIPEDYKFTSSISTSETGKVYYLNWRSNDTVNVSSINASVDDKGMILSYSRYTPDDYKLTKKLPALSRADAKAKADEYIEHIAPGLTKELKYEENYQESIMDTSYYLSYYRIVDGVPYYDDRVSVTVSRKNGDLQEYYRNWSSDLQFPASKGVIGLEKAEAAYVEKLGLRLIYGYSMEDDVLKTFPLYAPVYDNSYFAIDAFTGDRYRLTSGGYGRGFGSYQTVNSSAKEEALDRAGVRLSPEELKAVEDAGKLLDEKGAEELARKAEFLNITGDYELRSYYLDKNWTDDKQYTWTLNFVKPSKDENYADEDNVSVTINAGTGVITGFYKYSAASGDKKQPVDDITKAKDVTDSFLSKYYPEYYKQMEYDRISNEEYLADKTVPETYYNIRYSRLVNGVPFPSNGASFSYDNITGEITSFDLSWFETEFPSVDKVIEVKAATDSLLEKVGLGLEYRYEYAEVKPMTTKENQSTGKAVLVYMLKPGKPLYIDAFTGNVVYGSGEEYKEVTKVSYSDIKGHFAEKQISVLAEYGIYLDGSEFRPSEEMTQKDFLTYLSKTMSYYGPVLTEKSTQKDIDEMYAYMIREGIITQTEKSPDSAVTREEAVKFIIRALKYDKVADIKGIFSIGFKDAASISPELYGYVAIASGLGIINGDGTNFKPGKNITRGECAVMIYNYLQL